MIKILLVEDDTTLGQTLTKYLMGEGYEVNLATSVKEAGQYLESHRPEMIILDWMLPDGQGIDLLRDIRNKQIHTPVMMLTARNDTIDKVLGLESGANDYMTKPFEPRELLARIRVQIRDHKTSDIPKKEIEKIVLGDIEIDLLERTVKVGNILKEFTKMEFDFLRLLAETPNRAFSREEILNKVWGYENYPSTRTVDTHVLQLRQKLSDELIETVRGVGYKLKWKN